MRISDWSSDVCSSDLYVVVEIVVVDEGLAGKASDLWQAVSGRHQRAKECAHAGTANHVDRNAQIVQRPQQPDMREAACTATAQHPIGREPSRESVCQSV